MGIIKNKKKWKRGSKGVKQMKGKESSGVSSTSVLVLPSKLLDEWMEFIEPSKENYHVTAAAA